MSNRRSLHVAAQESPRHGAIAPQYRLPISPPKIAPRSCPQNSPKPNR
ncbi:MAG: hypothetical protein SNJ57_00395 [Cyanobacteriota bacterium]